MTCANRPVSGWDRWTGKGGRIRGLGALAAGLLAVLLAAEAAQAQLDARTLLNKAVPEVGPRHSDVEKAIEKFRVRDIDGAQKLLEQARTKDPMVPPAEILMAKMQLASGQGGAARASLEAAAKKYPQDPEPLLLFGEQAFNEGQVTDAQLLFTKAMQLASNYADNAFRKNDLLIRAHAGIASVAERQEDWNTAAQHLEQWVRLDPQSANAKHRMGRTQFMLNNPKEAYDLFAAAAKLDLKLPSPSATIGQLYDQKGRRTDAAGLMERALKEDATNDQTLMAVARWFIEAGQYAKAQTVLDAALKRQPESVDFLLLNGVVARMLKEYPAAEQRFEKAHVLAPTNFDAVNQLALTLIDQSEPEKQERAVQFAELNLRLHNNNPEAGIALGWIYYQMGRAQDAERVLNASLKAGQMGPDSSYFMARIFYDRGQGAMAAGLLEAALKSEALFVHRADAQALLTKIGRPADK